MQLDNDQTAINPAPFEAEEDTGGAECEWLLEQDMSDPVEQLFALHQEGDLDTELSEAETEMAGRPMFRGHGQGDDISSLFAEDIVAVDVGSGTDIYGDAESAAEDQQEAEQSLWIEHGKRSTTPENESVREIADGTDIFALSESDDIGETFLTLVSAKGQRAGAAATAPIDSGIEHRNTPPEPEHASAEQATADIDPADDDPMSLDLAIDFDAEIGAGYESNIEQSWQDIDSEELDVALPDVTATSDFTFGDELDLGSNPELISEIDLDSDVDLISDRALELEPLSQTASDLDTDPGADLAFDTEPTAGNTDAELDIGLDLMADLDSFSETGTERGSEWISEPALDMPKEESIHLASEELDTLEFDVSSDFDLSADFDEPLIAGLENSLPADAAVEPSFEIGNALDVEALRASSADLGDAQVGTDTDLQIVDQLAGGEDALTEQAGVPAEDSQDTSSCLEPNPESKSETVLDYVANTPAPLDDAAFDEYLLRGEELESSPTDDEHLAVEATKGVPSVDPAVDQSIDYHEDFAQMAGFQDDTVSAITGVISQVMQELSSSVAERLVDFDVDSEAIVIDVLLGNDVNSIIQCVSDGYLPIVEIQPQLPAALRQLGQSEVDAIYVRLNHPEIKADWNALFSDDFGVGSAAEVSDDSADIEQPQPFAAFDLDEFDFDSKASHEDDDAFDLVVDENLSAMTEFSSDDPLASIEFSAVLDSQDEAEEGLAELVTTGEGEVAQRSQKETELHWCVPADIKFNTKSTSGEIFTDFLDAFIEEATAELEKLEDAIGAWEGQSTGQVSAAPKAVTHTLHTVKGIAKGVGLQCYGTLMHNYETLLEALEVPVAEGASDYFGIVNAWLDAVMQGFEHIEATRTDVDNELPVQTPDAISPLDEPAPADLSSTENTDSVVPAAAEESVPSKLQAALMDAPAAKYIGEQQTEQQLADEGAKTLAGQQSIRMSAEAMDNLLNLTNQAQQLGVRSSQSTVRSKLAATELLGRLPSVRAHIARIADRALSTVNAKGESSGSTLDALEMDQYSELQEAANILRESVEDLDDLVNLSSRQASTAEALLKQQAAVISSLGSSIQAARVIPVSRMIPGLRRIVRTVGADLGKSVAFKVLNQVGTLDRDNHARCQVILEHMVRNAIDHGIESPQDRLAQGKPASGTITIDVKKHGADYVISLSDDGGGVDPALMRETAYRKGLDVDVDALTDDEAVKLIFHKGFSTASEVSEISGRGVGMDIVLTELKQIGGDIEIESVVGEGTQFHIRIPPNVSVNGALLVAAGERSYAIPLDGLIAVDNVDVDVFFDAVAEKRNLSLYGMDCEPAYLATLCQGNALPEQATWNNTVPVMIAGSEDRYMAIAVDDVKQALELVIRSLGVQFSNVPGVAGATTTVDGQAVVALDLNALVDSVDMGQHTNVSVTQEPEENLLVLVVDDSRTQRMVSTSQFDTLGVETITAENGMVAIDLLNTTHRLPDVILLDVEMPVKDGIQTLREIRKSVRYSEIPVIMVTSRTGAKHRALADEAGCNGYMGKPFNFPVLVEKIGELTGYNLQLN